MIFFILILFLLFYWLLYETYWLMIRLPIGKPSKALTLSEVEPIILTSMIIIGILKSMFGMKRTLKQQQGRRWYDIFRIILPPRPSTTLL